MSAISAFTTPSAAAAAADSDSAAGRELMIDLRSDTVTRPTPKMRQAMANAVVGDDVYGEDPTVNLLERRAAEIFGKEAALFVPTGTMGNTIAIKMLTDHGQEVLCESRAHILDWELSMTAWFSGCLVRTVQASDGVLRWEAIRGSIRRAGPHNAPTALIEIENTHNMAGGTVYPVEVIEEICRGAHELGIRVHMDGARIFNAAVACGRKVAEIAREVDSVMFCLSKGLGAPVGSMVVGRASDIARGRLFRKRLGGGMRQAGILAAAGLIALEEMPARLAEDHANAGYLASVLTQLPGIRIAHRVETNIVIFDISGTRLTTAEFSRALKDRGILMNGVNDSLMRLVTHYDVSREACEKTAEALSQVAALPAGRTESPIRRVE
jgi:threonine aldolase